MLRDEGHRSLKAEPLCKRLGVTRGSFYWHFESTGAFTLAVVERWEVRATEQVIAAVTQLNGGALAQLRLLLSKVGELDIDLYETINNLGTKNPELAAVLRRVHVRRVQFVAQLLEALDFDVNEATLRAQLIYAWAMGELLVREPHKKSYSRTQLDAIERLLFTR